MQKKEQKENIKRYTVFKKKKTRGKHYLAHPHMKNCSVMKTH